MAKAHRPPTHVIDMTPRLTASALAASALPDFEIERREELARYLLDPATEEESPEAIESLATADAVIGAQAAVPTIKFPSGYVPQPQLKSPMQASGKLKSADVLVVTWTVAEQNALADVLTPGYGRRTQSSKKAWHNYDRNFSKYLDLIRKGAPSRRVKRLGSCMQSSVAGKTVLCFKSELHLARDVIRNKTDPTAPTLPVRKMWDQLMDEVQPEVVITTGTSGGVFPDYPLGGVAVTRAAQFHCQAAFKQAPYNNKKYYNDWNVPTKYFPKAQQLMKSLANKLVEPPLLPPSPGFDPENVTIQPPKNVPNIYLEGKKWQGGPKALKEHHPILTTDYFEFGTTTNHLEKLGCAVEMGDAVLGLACSERKDAPSWLVIRNFSDPCINGALQGKGQFPNMQTHWAVWYYQTYGYWTSMMSALATWGVIAGLADK
ncbi:MAG TPA: hypothetical protein VHD36_15580 [Pirellulales bacterium]|nr:hypothetical protein [Pirellulales bacterium]